jgi:hypothetical protein
MAEEKPDRITIAPDAKPSAGAGRAFRRFSRDRDGDSSFFRTRSISRDAESAYYDEGLFDE